MKSSYKIIIMLVAFLGTSAMTLTASAGGKDKHLPISSTSDEAKEIYYEATRLLSNAHTEQALQKFDEAITADPQFFMAHGQKALALANNKEKGADAIDKTLALPQEALTPAEQIIRKMLVKVQESKGSEEKPDMTALCEELVSTYPTTLEAYGIASAVAGFIDDNKDVAIKYTNKVIELDPSHGPAYNTLGYYWMEKGDLAKAKEAFENYVRVDPDEANAHDSMGDYYMKAGDYDKSAECFDKAVAMGMDASRERGEKAKALAAGEEPKDEMADEPEDE